MPLYPQLGSNSGTIVVAALLLGALSGCGGENNASVEDQIKELAASAPESQQQILADGRVLPSEYERAVIAERDCVEQAGFVVHDLVWSEGQLGFDAEWMGEIEAEQDAANIRALDACKDDYSRIVARAAILQDTPTASEREALRPELVQCLRAAGIQLEEEADDQDIFTALTDAVDNASASECVTEHYQDFIAGE